MVETVVMAHVVEMMAELVETVVMKNQFPVGMVTLLFQEGKKCILNNGRCTTFHKQGRCGVFQT